jgi:hypothetical protein
MLSLSVRGGPINLSRSQAHGDDTVFVVAGSLLT